MNHVFILLICLRFDTICATKEMFVILMNDDNRNTSQNRSRVLKGRGFII